MIDVKQQNTINQWSYLTLALSLTMSPALMAAPGSAQQSVLNAEQAVAIEAGQVKKPAPPKTAAEKAAQLKQLMKNPAFKAAFEKMLKHPNLTFTAKSILTPAAIPMNWGGVGFSGGVVNRYPTATRDGWPGGASIALPFGDSDKLIGGAVSVNWANITSNTLTTTHYENNTGTVSLMFSRWLAANTIASAGVLNLAPWGLMKEAPKSYNAVITQLLGVRVAGGYHPMSASIGIGSGALGPIGQVGTFSDSKIYPFLNTAFNFTRNIAIAGDYYGDTFALGLSYNTAIKAPVALPLSFMVYAANIKHSDIAPSTFFGLRVSTGVALPSFKHA